MLPPDNFQEDPKPVVAHRTSPTNLGLYLLSVVAARDFGWLGLLDTVERLDATLATMNGLERFRGHFYNWYDTQDLRPLDPKYVSSVDSGNLAGHLIALDNACREMIGRPVVSPEWLAGIADALALTRESLRALADDRRTQTVTRKQLDDALDALAASLSPAPATPAGVAAPAGGARPARGHRHRHRANADRRARRWRRRRGADLGGGARRIHPDPRARRRAADALRAAARGRGRCSGRSSTRSRPWPICRTAARRLSPSWRERRARAERRRPARWLDRASSARRAAARSLERRLVGTRRAREAACSTRWSSAFSSTPRDSCSRSGTGWPTASSIPAVTTCSPRKRASRASSRSPRATCRCGIGSGSGAP